MQQKKMTGRESKVNLVLILASVSSGLVFPFLCSCSLVVAFVGDEGGHCLVWFLFAKGI